MLHLLDLLWSSDGLFLLLVRKLWVKLAWRSLWMMRLYGNKAGEISKLVSLTAL